MLRILGLSLLATLSLPSQASAQFGNSWTSFELSPGSLPTGMQISDDNHETDLAWGDVDLDGDIDLIIVRKEPWTTAGMRTNVLLLNEGGVLVDRTSSHAALSDVPGDLGFLSPTNDRDVVLADLNGDGYLDIITATEQSPGQPKHISHPRIYMNLGESGGVWQGFRYEASRIPEFLHLGSGIPLLPHLASLAAGDVDNDGDIDLYFGDHDTTLTFFGAIQLWAEDLEDHLLINDGNGFFTDGTTVGLSLDMVKSGFCNSVELVDINQDGVLDIVKQTSYQNPVVISIAYNDPANPGVFSSLYKDAASAPYYISTGDLNNDGRLDLAVTSNNDDYVRLNLGNLPNGHVDWSPDIGLQLLTGSEPEHPGFPLSYSSNNLIVDLDGDGFSEVLIADVDVEIKSYAEGFRTRIYHNQTGTPGASSVDLVEERGSLSDSTWLGAPGLHADDLRWTHDIAVFDVNGDGKQDLILSRREGTQVWLQGNAPTCQADLGFGTGPVLEICGGDLSTGNGAELILRDGQPSAALFLAIGSGSNPTPLAGFGVTLVPAPVTSIVNLGTDSNGVFTAPIPGGLGPGTVYIQIFQVAASGTSLIASNALQVDLLP